MTLEDLIEELSVLQARLHMRALTMEQFRELGWARRPLQAMIDRCREEREEQSFWQKHAQDTAPLKPIAKCKA